MGLAEDQIRDIEKSDLSTRRSDGLCSKEYIVKNSRGSLASSMWMERSRDK